MPIPAGQYAVIEGDDDAFSAFSVGNVVTVSNTASNDGIYTVNAITTDGTHSYMGLSGKIIRQELNAGSDVDITPIIAEGNKIIAIGDEDTGVVKVWSYNEAAASPGTVLESPAIGTSGWSNSAITPRLTGTNSRFVYTSGQSALRVCDSNINNSGMIKHYSYINRNPFGGQTGGGYFAGFEENVNVLHKPAIGGRVITTNESVPTVEGTTKESYGINEDYTGSATTDPGGAGYIRSDFHLRRSLGEISTDTYDLSGSPNPTQNYCQLDPEQSNIDTTSVFIKIQDSVDLAKIPIGAVIGFVNQPNVVDHGTTYHAEKMLVRNIDAENNIIQVYRGYAGSVPTALVVKTYPYIIQYGCGWNFSVSEFPATGQSPSGTYEAETYEFAQSFIYDGNQESLLRVPRNWHTFATSGGAERESRLTVERDFKALKIYVYAFGPYNGRITGGRIYIRIHGSNEPWSLLVDIDIEKGCRTSMDAFHTGWADHSGTDGIPDGCFVSGAMYSRHPQPDKYADINNYYPDISRNSFGYPGESYQTSVTGGERAWIGNIKITQKSGVVERFGDRIMYSEYGKYDVFPDLNYFTSSKGDAEDVIMLKYFGDRLLIFKTRTLHMWNVASPETINWYHERTVEFAGISNPYSVTSTPYGIVWANVHGCYFYDGQQISDLTEGKIRDIQNSYHGANIPPNWEDFIRAEDYDSRPMLIYSPKEKQLYIQRDPAGGTSSVSNRCFIYNFMTRSWVYNDGIFTTDIEYTNSIIDWNGNPVIAYEDEIDLGVNLQTIFDKDELIGGTNDNTGFTDGSSQWELYDPDGDTGATFTFADANDRLEIDGTVDTDPEGAQLAISGNITGLVVGKTYRVVLGIQPSVAMLGIPFTIGLGGATKNIGELDNQSPTVATTHTADITIANATDPLVVYNEGGTTVKWYVNSASVKEISLDLTADVSTLIGRGDVLRVNRLSGATTLASGDPYFLIREVAADKVIVEPAYLGSTLSDHEAGSDVYIRKAVFKQLDNTSVATGRPQFITKDIDFDSPGMVKKIYKILFTYTNSGSALTNTDNVIVKVATNGSTSFTNSGITSPEGDGSFTLTGTFLGSKTYWHVAAFTFDRPLPCQSIALWFNNGNTANGLSFNDISFEYRVLYRRVVNVAS